MNSYNDVIPERINYVVTRIFNRIYDDKGNKVSITKYVVKDPEYTDINYCATNGLTYSTPIEFFYNLTDSDGNTNEQSLVLYIPRMSNNIFVINGATRVSSTELSSSHICRNYSNSILFDYFRSVDVDDKDPSTSTCVVRVKHYDEEYNLIQDTFLASDDEGYLKYRERLSLTEFQINKLKVKLDYILNGTDKIAERGGTRFDVDPVVGSHITKELIEALLMIGSDKYLDLIIDKECLTIDKNLVRNITSGDSLKRIVKNIRRKFYKSKTIYAKDIQNAIDSFFRVADSTSIEIPTIVNPLSFDALSYKIKFNSSVSYNRTYADLIDPSDTPANGKSGISNSLNVCVRLDDNDIYIKCYKYPSMERVELVYMTYLNSKVLSNTEIDWDSNELLVKGKKSYDIMYRMNLSQTTDLSEIHYVEPKPDEKLSLTSRRSAMINVSDSTRNAMGDNMMKQAEELPNAEEAYVSSGNGSEDIDKSTLSVFYKGEFEGKVTEITSTSIKVKDSKGNESSYTIPNVSINTNDSIVTYSVIVTEGQKLKKGDPMIVPYMNRNTDYMLGMNIRTAYMFYKGYNYEDAIIVSESLAKLMYVVKFRDIVVNVRAKDVITYIKPLGMKCSSGDILINMKSVLNVSDSVSKAYQNLPILNFLKLNYLQNNTLVPNNVDLGYLIDVKVLDNPKVKINDPETGEVIEKYKTYLESYKPEHNEDIPDRYLSMKIGNEVLLGDGASYTIVLRLAFKSYLTTGKKISNRWGNKGEISLVLPDDQMPYNPETGERVDCILNPSSVEKRKNPPQLHECLISKLSERIYSEVKKMMDSGVKYPEIQEYLREFYRSKYDKVEYDDFSRGMRQKGTFYFKFEVGSFFKYDLSTLLKWSKRFNISGKERLVDPELGPIDNEITVGKTYLLRLYHDAAYSGKVTSEIVDSSEPYMGKGLYRPEGQKISEMDNWAFTSRGSIDMINKQRSSVMEGTQYSLINELLIAGFYVKDPDDLPMLSPYRDYIKTINKMK